MKSKLMFVLLLAGCFNTNGEDRARKACAARGGRQIAVHGGKYAGWVCSADFTVDMPGVR